MRSINHIEAQIEKQPWREDASGCRYVRKEEFKDQALYEDMLQLFRENHRKGANTPDDSIYLGDYRYWLDETAESLCREKLSLQPLPSRVLTSILKKMIRELETMPDNSSVSSSEMMERVADIRFFQNLSRGPLCIVIDGVIYGEYTDRKGHCRDIEWEICDRFNAAAIRHGFIIDNSNIAFKVLGLPYYVDSIYRRKANLLKKAEGMTSSDDIVDAEGNVLYRATEWTSESDGNCLMVMRIAPEAPEVRMNTGSTCVQIEALSGDIVIRTHHPLYTTVYGETEARWIDTGEEKKCHGKGGLCAQSDYDDEETPWESYFTIDNIGDEEVTVLVSREALLEEEDYEEE